MLRLLILIQLTLGEEREKSLAQNVLGNITKFMDFFHADLNQDDMELDLEDEIKREKEAVLEIYEKYKQVYDKYNSTQQDYQKVVSLYNSKKTEYQDMKYEMKNVQYEYERKLSALKMEYLSMQNIAVQKNAQKKQNLLNYQNNRMQQFYVQKFNYKEKIQTLQRRIQSYQNGIKNVSLVMKVGFSYQQNSFFDFNEEKLPQKFSIKKVIQIIQQKNKAILLPYYKIVYVLNLISKSKDKQLKNFGSYYVYLIRINRLVKINQSIMHKENPLEEQQEQQWNNVSETVLKKSSFLKELLTKEQQEYFKQDHKGEQVKIEFDQELMKSESLIEEEQEKEEIADVLSSLIEEKDVQEKQDVVEENFFSLRERNKFLKQISNRYKDYKKEDNYLIKVEKKTPQYNFSLDQLKLLDSLQKPKIEKKTKKQFTIDKVLQKFEPKLKKELRINETPIQKLSINSDIVDDLIDLNESIIGEYLERNLYQYFMKDFVFASEIIESKEDKYLQKLIEKQIERYFHSKKEKFMNFNKYAEWLQNYVEMMKSLGLLKSYSKISSAELIKKLSNQK